MTREKAEQKIKEKLLEIIAIYKEYDPKGDFIDLTYNEGCISFFNRYWESDKRLDVWEEIGNGTNKI